MNRLILFLLPVGLLFFSCRKITVDANDDPQGFADSQVVGTWKITGLDADIAHDWDGNGASETDVYSTWLACEKDNLYVFSPDMTGDFKRNCNTLQDGEWEILNTRFLVLSPLTAPTEIERMIAMTAVQFITTKQVVIPSGQTVTLRKTWTRQ